jgi:hypothetical protein
VAPSRSLTAKILCYTVPLFCLVQVGAKRVVDLCLGAVEGSSCSGGYFTHCTLSQPSLTAKSATVYPVLFPLLLLLQVGAKRVVDVCRGEVEGSNCSWGYFTHGTLS